MSNPLLDALWSATQPGLRCIAFRGKNFKGWAHRWFDNTERATSFIKWLDSKDDIEAVYHACAIYDPAKVEAAQEIDKANTGRDKSSVGRLSENVLGTFGLWCDIDIKPDHPNAYPDAPAALAAVRSFAKDFLPPSQVVMSGGGLHLYWLAEEFLDRETAQNFSDRLKLLAAARGFRADPSRTADLASVLRPPGTMNRKRDPAVQVDCRDTGRRYTAEDFEAALAEIEAPEASVLIGRPPAGAVIDNSDLVDNTFQPTSIRDVAKGCRQIRESILRKGADDPEPFWKDVLRTLARCTDGSDKVLHGVSSGHESYDAAEVQRKIAHIRKMGPATCASIESNNPGGCDGCPHQGREKFSPIRLSENKFQAGTTTTTAGGVQFLLPPQSEAGSHKFDFAVVDGVQCMRYQTKVPDADGNMVWSGQWQPMSQTLYMLTGVERDYATGSHVGVYRFREPKGRIFEARANMKDLPEQKGLFQFLADSGVVVNSGDKHVRNAHVAMNKLWLDKVQAAASSTVVYDTFGWSENNDGDIDGFVGAYHYHVDGSITPSALRGGAKQMQSDGVRVKGSVDEWLKVATTFCRKGTEIQQMCLMLSIFGPFVAAAKFPSSFCPVSLVSGRGGQGKTTTARLALSVWMAPDMFRTQVDTAMRRIKDVATARHLPFVFDEMTTVKPAEMAEIIYNISNGKERARLRSNGEQMPTSEVRLPLFMTANGTVRDALERALQAKADAAQTRVVEVEMQKDPKLEQELIATRILDLLPHNYGVAGDWWMRYMLGVDDGEKRLDQFIEEAKAMLTFVEQRMPDPAAYRFYAINAATVLLGAKWCERTGFLPVKYKDMERYMLKTLMGDQHGQRTSYQQDLPQYVADFLHDNMSRVVEATVVRPMRKIVYPDGETKELRGAGHVEYASVSPDPERFRGDKIVARWEIFFNRYPHSPATTVAETRILVSKGALRAYLNERFCDVKTFVSTCTAAGLLTSYRGVDNMTVTNRSLAALERKYRDNAPLVDVYVFDPTMHESLSGVAQEVVERASEQLDNVQQSDHISSTDGEVHD